MELTISKNKTSKQLLWIGIAAIIMFFAGLTSAYVVRKAEGNWLEYVMPIWFMLSTIAIIVSSILLWISVKKIKSGKSSYIYILSTLILGLFFAYSQFQGWQELVSEGIFLTGEGSNPSGSFLYVITLLHLLHLLGGLITLCVSTINAKRGKYTSTNYLGIELTSIYWHFLGLLWLYLFLFLIYI
jgi:cytochrome c oxidase subunit 3